MSQELEPIITDYDISQFVGRIRRGVNPEDICRLIRDHYETNRRSLVPNAGGQWTPLSDGEYDGLEVCSNGSEIGLTFLDVYDIDWPIERVLPDNIRLCRLNSDAPQVPLTIPDEVRDAMAILFDYSNRFGYEMADAIDIVRPWLEAQRPQ
jgi:hypothetical protein